MKPVFKLQDLLQQGESAISATSILLGQEMINLDCFEVESLSPEQLNYLFSGIPQTWGFAKLKEVFNSNTVTLGFATQLNQLIAQRLGSEIEIASQESGGIADNSIALTSLATLDIFNLRDEVISDYRRYIKSFLKIREPRT